MVFVLSGVLEHLYWNILYVCLACYRIPIFIWFIFYGQIPNFRPCSLVFHFFIVTTYKIIAWYTYILIVFLFKGLHLNMENKPHQSSLFYKLKQNAVKCTQLFEKALLCKFFFEIFFETRKGIEFNSVHYIILSFVNSQLRFNGCNG